MNGLPSALASWCDENRTRLADSVKRSNIVRQHYVDADENPITSMTVPPRMASHNPPGGATS